MPRNSARPPAFIISVLMGMTFGLLTALLVPRQLLDELLLLPLAAGIWLLHRLPTAPSALLEHASSDMRTLGIARRPYLQDDALPGG